MADGQQKPPKRRWLRPPAPHIDGPLASSGAAPEDPARPAAAPAGGGVPTPPSETAEEPTSGASAAKAAAPDAKPGLVEAEDDTTGSEASAGHRSVASGAGVPPEVSADLGSAAGTGSDPEVAADPAATSKPAADDSGTSGSGLSEPGAVDEDSAPKPEATDSGDKGTAPTAGKGSGGPAADAGNEAAGQTTEKIAGETAKKDGTKDSEKTAGEVGDKAGDKTAGKDGDKAGDSGGDKGKDGGKGTGAPSAAAVAAASKGRATRVLRSANPVRVARNTARSTSAWAKRPSGRLIVPAIIAVLLLGGAGAAGVYLVPKALQSVPSPSATPGFGVDGTASGGVAPSLGGGSASAPALGDIPAATPPLGVGAARPADALAAWAQQTGTRAGIPVVAVQAYGYAELVAGRTTPACHLNWTTIAAIAKVESSHGSANGAVLSVDGSVAPAILGLPLDGKGGRQLVRDSDQGLLDGDTQFDRALGPLQFIPQTWAAISVGNGVDADNNGVSDPNDIDDASLAAARYLCQNGRDLSKPDAWWEAILSYNAVRPYAQKVFDTANEYGQRTRL